MRSLLGIGAPVIAVVVLIGFKLPHKWKMAFFKVPTWVSSTIMALIVGHFLRGVSAPIAMLVLDFMLWPAFEIIKKHTMWVEKKEQEKLEPKEKSEPKEKPHYISEDGKTIDITPSFAAAWE